MDKRETGVLLMYLKSLYPTWAKGMSQQDVALMIEAWTDMLQEYPIEIVKLACKAACSKDTAFPPSIGEIIAKIQFIKQEEKVLTEVEAWGLVKKAIRNSAYNSQSEFDKLPESIRTTIGNHEILKDWAMNANGDVDTVIGSNFMRSYKANLAKKKENDSLPHDVKKAIGMNQEIKQLAEKMKI